MLPMSTTEPAPTEARGRGSRTVVVSFLGAVVRRMGNWMPIGGSIDLMAPLGIDGPSVRTAVFRLKKRGWLESESRGGSRGYALTPEALRSLAAGDEVIWHSRQSAALEDGWCIVNFSVPEAERSKRQQLRAHLASLGFGNVGTAMWIAPARMQAAAERAISELGLTRYSAVFVGDHVAGQDLASLLYESWDLTGIDARYRAFIDEFGPVADEIDASGVVDPQRAFTTYLTAVDGWRRLPYRDPGLPRELLSPDWSGPDAAALFERLVATLEGRALAHAARHWPVS